MRLKQLLGMILLAGATTVPAAGGDVAANGNSAAASKPAEAATATEARHLSRISGISVAQGEDGFNVEISADRTITAKAIKLSQPDRIVLDIVDSILVGSARQIPVNNGDVKDVRAARYQSAPPTTRVVVDMAAMHDFEILPAGNKLVLKLKNTNPDASASRQAPLVKVQKEEPARATKDALVPQPQPVPARPEPVQPELKTAAKGPEQGADSKPAKPVNVTFILPTQDARLEAELLSTKTAAEARQAKGDEAASHFVKPGEPLMVSANQPPTAGNASLSAHPAAVNAALQQQQQPQQLATAQADTATSCTGGHYSGAPLNLDLKDLDIKDFFRLIHEISGLNVVLDPGVRGIVTIDVTDIPWDQALAIVLRNNGLECELEGNVLRVATLETLRAEADARRAQQEAQAMAVPRQNYTRYLSYAHSKDVVAIIKKFLSPRGDAVSDERSNAIVIEDIPSTLPKIDAILTKLDRKTPQVEIEARVVSATRNFARDIGTQIGFGWGNGVTGTGGGTSVADPIQAAPPGGTGAIPPWITFPGQTSQIPLFSNLPATNATSGFSIINQVGSYRLDFTLTMAESRGLAKVLSRPRIITQNNIPGLIRQGQRIPVVTLSQLGGPPTVTYVDAFLRLTVTPQITTDNTIFLLLDVENTTADFTHVTGQQLNPTLDTQQATTQVLVTDGQTVVVGGVIQTTNNLAINQIPLLGSIPVLGNLFKHTSVNTTTAELLFFITPKIIET